MDDENGNLGMMESGGMTSMSDYTAAALATYALSVPPNQVDEGIVNYRLVVRWGDGRRLEMWGACTE